MIGCQCSVVSLGVRDVSVYIQYSLKVPAEEDPESVSRGIKVETFGAEFWPSLSR